MRVRDPRWETALVAQTGGLTFLFTDIEGSTRLVEELKTGWGLTLRTCRRMVENICEQHGGREFGNEGDGQFFVFGTPAAAAHAAIDAQRRAAGYQWPDDVELRLRMAIHCGPVRLSGGEYVGRTVHEVARLLAATNGGQILCSADIADALAACDDMMVVSLGLYSLRGISGERELFQVVADGMQAEIAPPREAARAGGRKITIWRRDGAESCDADLASARMDWIANVHDVDVSIAQEADGIRVTVLRGGRVDEEYCGLTIGGTCDVGAVVNTWSRLIRIDAEPTTQTRATDAVAAPDP